MSGAHLGRHDFRGAGLADKLRPDTVPVIGAQVPAADSLAGCPLNGRAVLRGRPAARIAVLPLADLRRALRADLHAELARCQAVGIGEVFIKGHAS